MTLTLASPLGAFPVVELFVLDMATMDRILAEDFVLMTGRGRTYTKADLSRRFLTRASGIPRLPQTARGG